MTTISPPAPVRLEADLRVASTATVPPVTHPGWAALLADIDSLG